MRLCSFILLLAFALGGHFASGVQSDSAYGQPRADFVIGISPYLENSVKDEVFRGVVRLLVEDLPLNSTVGIYDAFNLKSITRVMVPNARVFNSSKTRANQFAPAIRDLKLFLATEHPWPTNARLNFEATIHLPQFLDFLTENVAGTNLAILLVGSPLYQDAKEPAFSMVDGYFPSDGHLRASRDKSPFGLADARAASSTAVHWIYFGDPWTSDLHKEKVTRFWTLYLEHRGMPLSTFSGDLSTVLQNFRQGVAAGPRTGSRWALDPEQTKIEMLRVGRSVDVADWLTRDGVQMSQRPPSVLVGPMKIGIRWKNNLDLDLYATPRSGAETLFFQHMRSPEGYYYKDHRSSPGREYEFIEFESPVDVREIEASVNFYKGICPGGAHGEVRIEFDGRIYGADFFIPASEGNKGRSSDSQKDFWTRIPVQEILKLTVETRAGG